MSHTGEVNSQPLDDSPATEAETRAALLERNRRPFTPVNKLFVQAQRGSESRVGPLAWFVRGRDLRALQAYLLIIGVNGSGDSEHGWSTTLPIKVWARAFDTTRNATDASAATAVSKVLSRLEKRHLIERARRGRSRDVRVTLLREDGTGQPYTRPGKDNNDPFLKLPNEYWTEGWHDKLDLPATAMLLVALHGKPGFELPTKHMPEWYGWSADTAERGFKTLREHGLLQVFTRLKKAPLSPTGLTEVHQYHLLPPFGTVPETPETAPTSEDLMAQALGVPSLDGKRREKIV